MIIFAVAINPFYKLFPKVNPFLLRKADKRVYFALKGFIKRVYIFLMLNKIKCLRWVYFRHEMLQMDLKFLI